MKYPQLVSPRAVNAISDWLVSRLEQLGVESPQIYTRLLLSLLQSSVQVNDPIEFSNLEAFFASRKGGHRRFHLPSDTETLKKLNAVQCLREIVSNEQETATIEHLVEELCEKLKDIERQTQDLNDEQQFLIESNLNNDSLLQAQINLQLQQQQQQQQNQQQQQPSSSSVNNQHNSRHHHHNTNNNNNSSNHQQLPSSHVCNNSHNTTTLSHNNNNNSGDSKQHYNGSATTAAATTTTADVVNDIDNDPKNRYFRAFPALSKEMEESFRIWRRNAKSFTWPIVGRSIQGIDNCNNNNNNNLNNHNNNNNSNSASLSSSSASSIISTSTFGISLTNSADKSFEKKIKAEGGGGGLSHPNQLVNKVSAETASVHISGSSGHVHPGDVELHQHQAAVGAVVSAKKKSKRRRNQALCKGKNIQSARKLSTVGNTSNSVGSNKYHHYSHHRNTSPAWDTDFKGCWEMGPDLIKDFLTRQNSNKRNRSDSNSMDQEEHIERKTANEMSSERGKPAMKRYIDLSFCCDDDDDDSNTQQLYSEEVVDYVDTDYDDNTLTSISELAMDSMHPKRLYQREGHLQKLVVGNVLVGNTESDNTLDGLSDSVDPTDFQQFKAKFNSSVEALWKDAESSNSVNFQPTTENSLKINNSDSGTGISSNFYATTSLNALAPFKKDLWNFWSNYNQQQQYEQKLGNKLSTTASSSSMITTRVEDSSASSGVGADIANSSDYFSMPSNLDDFDKSVGGIRRAHDAAASLDAHTPSINVFLQNSIWSTSGDCVDAIGASSTADTDESFLIKVWHSNKKLSQLDVGHAISGEKMPTTLTSSADGGGGGGELDYIKSKESSILNNPNLGANLQFPPYQNLKWSEGINAGPACNSLHSNTNIPNASALRDDTNYGNFSSAANISGATWEAPAYGQNAQPDLKSWCASNPMSLTEMYGSDVCDSIVNQPSSEDSEENPADVNIGPAVTLPNHSVSSSGFVAYARVKQCGIVKPQTKPLQTSNALRLPKDFFRSGEEENLLTSERTHFRPIENFVDGHTFEISNALDSVDFERTESGLLYYDSEEYLEYTRNDIYMADEEVSTSSTNLLKYGKKPSEDKSDMFVIKFRVRRSEETACQTEEKDFELAAAKMTEIPTTATLSNPTYFSNGEVNNMFHNTFTLSRQANNEAIMAAVTKAVAAAAKAAAENHLNSGHFSWLHPTHTSSAATSRNCTLENNPIWLVSDPSVCDEVDFCKTNSLNSNLNYGPSVETSDVNGLHQQQQLTQHWSMQEVEKQCHQRRYMPQLPQQHQHELKRKFPTSVDIERNEENSLDNTSLHTLWGMCAACNSCEYGKSMPANRLLRDELQLEADEIMSDLRYMQDLYIGETNIVTEANENNAEDIEDIDNKMEREEDCKFMKNPWNADNDNVQVSMLQKVNRLIEDLLKPDNVVKLPIETQQSYDKLNKEIGQNNVWNLQHENAESKNLWQYGEENTNIWHHKSSMEQQQDGKHIEQSENIIKPMKLLKQVGSSLTEEPQCMDTLNWEHEHLAKIWQKESTLSNSKDIEDEQQLQHDEIENRKICEELQKEEEEELSKGSQQLVEEKNLRNLQSINSLTPPSTVAACHTYERVQHFLNNSAAKLKLAANRKRRHSASQNFYQQQQQHLNYTNNGNNNNNDNITDLNVYKHQLNDALKDTKEHQQQHQQQQQPLDVTPYKIDTKNNNFDEQPKRQTIITCKYWTTATNGTQSSLDSAAAAMMLLAAATKVNSNADTIYDGDDVLLEENIFGNTFSCLIDKNASILKHMTMMTRPLTR